MIFFVSGIPCAILCNIIARRKGKSAVSWSIAGFIFGLLALITLQFFVKDSDNLLR